MKRDNDLIREMLLEFEADHDWLLLVPGGVSGESDEDRKRRYHMFLLADDGMLLEVGNDAMRLTSRGHDFIEAIRSDSIWKKATDGGKTIGGATIGMLKDLAVAYLKQAAHERPGITLS